MLGFLALYTRPRAAALFAARPERPSPFGLLPHEIAALNTR